jgi:phosphosulfolactate phosphohydrolase-like enzyme
MRLVRSFRDASEALHASRSGWNLRQQGMDDDIAWCARENTLANAPRLTGLVGPAAVVV